MRSGGAIVVDSNELKNERIVMLRPKTSVLNVYFELHLMDIMYPCRRSTLLSCMVAAGLWFKADEYKGTMRMSGQSCL